MSLPLAEQVQGKKLANGPQPGKTLLLQISPCCLFDRLPSNCIIPGNSLNLALNRTTSSLLGEIRHSAQPTQRLRLGAGKCGACRLFLTGICCPAYTVRICLFRSCGCRGKEIFPQALLLSLQGCSDRSSHQTAHDLGTFKTDLALSRMHIHIHLCWQYMHMEHTCRQISPHEMPLQGLPYCMAEHGILHCPLVDEKAQPGCACRGLFRQEQIARNPDAAIPAKLAWPGIFILWGMQGNEHILITKYAAHSVCLTLP